MQLRLYHIANATAQKDVTKPAQLVRLPPPVQQARVLKTSDAVCNSKTYRRWLRQQRNFAHGGRNVEFWLRSAYGGQEAPWMQPAARSRVSNTPLSAHQAARCRAPGGNWPPAGPPVLSRLPLAADIPAAVHGRERDVSASQHRAPGKPAEWISARLPCAAPQSLR